MNSKRGGWTKGDKIVLGFIFGVIAGLIAVPAILSMGVEKGGGISIAMIATLIGIGFSFFAIFFVGILVHELGHLVAGSLVGFKFQAVKVGRFYIWKSRGKLKLSYDGKGSGSSGWAGMDWEGDKNIVARYRIYVAGGPLASLTLLALGLCFLPWQLGGAQNLATFLSFSAILIWVVVAGMSIIPRKSRTSNDAVRFIQTFAKGDEGERQALIFKFSGQRGQGARCRDWNIEDLRRIRELTQSSFERALYSLSLGCACIYRGELDEGIAMVEEAYAETQARTGIYDAFEKSIALEMAFVRAYWRGDAVGAAEALNRAARYNIGPGGYGQARAEAALALANGEAEKAIELARKGAETIRKEYDSLKPTHEACLEEMDDLEKKAMALSNPA